MDGSNSVMIAQAILIWTLLGFLLAWLITFAVLALRPDTTDTGRSSDLPKLSRAHSITSTSAARQVLSPQPVPRPTAIDRQDTGEMEAIPLA